MNVQIELHCLFVSEEMYLLVCRPSLSKLKLNKYNVILIASLPLQRSCVRFFTFIRFNHLKEYLGSQSLMGLDYDQVAMTTGSAKKGLTLQVIIKTGPTYL